MTFFRLNWFFYYSKGIYSYIILLFPLLINLYTAELMLT